MEEFNIEKAESLDFDALEPQLKYIFKTEQDCVNFVNFLKNINNFVNLSNDKRHMALINLGYFKSQLFLFEKKVKAVLDKRKTNQMREAIKKAKGCGDKVTESTLAYYIESDSSAENLEELLNLVSAWYNFLQDIYFICGQTNKSLGSMY